MVKAVLCDIDGTLVQSNWLHAEAWQKAFAEMDVHLELEAVRRQIGKGGNELIPVFVSWWRRKEVTQPLKKLRSYIFKTEYMHRVEPLPGAKAFLEKLKAVGIRPSLSTSASEEDLKTYKKLLGAEDLIDEETSASDTDRAKPNPDIFEETLKKLGLKASEVLALGDTPYDAEAAGLAGISTIGVETGGWSREDLLEAGCIEVYKSVEELLERFDESALVRC